MTGAAPRLTAALADRYRIERELGAGGMATVYLAEDLKHDRKVAIKVLKPELAAVLGAERFVQEIKTTAALSHPHILPLFDSGEAGGFLYYVMPYIEGETIRDRLNRETQLGVEEAVRITTEVADALDYAHRHGVIHRDIKPENILLHDGRAMVMDFGIALAVSAAAGGRMTETGLSLGTPHYMSPEQATADKDITARSDVYSLASVLYEMLAGVPPHEGGSAQQTIMRIITETPKPVSELRRSVPPNVSAATAKALEKLPADRFESASAFAEALRNPGFTTATTLAGTASGLGSYPLRSWIRSPWSWGMTALAAAALAFSLIAERAPEARALSTSVVLPDSLELKPLAVNSEGAPTLALSPDGSLLVFVGGRPAPAQLYGRSLSDFSVRGFEGTEGATAPFFSPGGEAVAFLTGTELKLLSLADGRVTTLSPTLGSSWGGTWAPDGRIILSRNRALLILSSRGDSLNTVSCPAFCTFPDMMPDGRRVLVQGSGGFSVVSLETGEGAPILKWNATDEQDALPGQMGRLDADGHLVYVGPDGRLLAAPFDASTARVTGPSVPVAEGVRVESGRGAAQLALSRTGSLVFAPGEVMSRGLLVRADRTGKLDTVPAPPADYNALALSPDGRRIIASVGTANGDEVLQVIDALTGSVQPWTRGRSFSHLSWTDGGQRVVFNDATRRPFIGNPDESGPPTPLVTDPMLSWAQAIGDSAGYYGWVNDTLVVLPADGRPAVRVVGPRNPSSLAVVGGRWIVAEESAVGEGISIVARAIDGIGRRIVLAPDRRFSMLSGTPGGQQVFMADGVRTKTPSGQTLQTFYAMRFDPANPAHPFGAPQVLFVHPVADFPGRNYAADRAGNRFVFKQHLATAPLREVRLLTGWHERLRGGTPQ